MSNSIILNKISKSFRTEKKHTTKETRYITPILDEVSFSIPLGSVVSLIGPNGCGKTTLLNILAGILSPDSGKITYHGNTDTNVNPGVSSLSHDTIKISYMVQNSDESLLPWKRAWDNITFPLELAGKSKHERKIEAEKLIGDIGLGNILDNLNMYPYQMSGGQKQACNIARAVTHSPALLLMDEPFLSLDYQTRLLIEDKLVEILERKNLTSVLVSHDLEEAIYMSDFVILLSRKPTHIIEIFKIPFGHPRKRELLKTDEFFKIRNKMFELLKEEFEL